MYLTSNPLSPALSTTPWPHRMYALLGRYAELDKVGGMRNSNGERLSFGFDSLMLGSTTTKQTKGTFVSREMMRVARRGAKGAAAGIEGAKQTSAALWGLSTAAIREVTKKHSRREGLSRAVAKGRKQLRQPKELASRTAVPLGNALPPRGTLPVPPRHSLAGDSLSPKARSDTQRPGDPIRAYLGLSTSAHSAAPAQIHFLPPGEYMHELRECARRLRDPSFTLHDFYDSCKRCFPELQLYMCGDDVGDDNGEGGTTSGRTPRDEYLRTVGALFAVYWLSRLELPTVHGSEGLDGQRGFCFGVDAEWRPPSERDIERIERMDVPVAPPTASDVPLDKALKLLGQDVAQVIKDREEVLDAKRQATFMRHIEWGQLQKLMVDSGVLVSAGGPASSCGTEVQVERTAAMLALTAIHDIMKIESLLPMVLPQHAPFHGYREWELISDHDIALAYVLEHDPTCLPCFATLPEALQRPIRFTQSKLGFNHGWLVQAEAPPGLLFNNFKHLIDTVGVDSTDIAFYFVHWLTDLAGAEPSGPGPMGGAEKFTKRFPRVVLASFVKSFPIVQRLALVTPTELNEQFLRAWWPPELGLTPTDEGSIARIRLIVQAQTLTMQQSLNTAFDQLPPEKFAVLRDELSRTGRPNEAYTATPTLINEGPAFCLYYGPAFLRHCTNENASIALLALAELYAAARSLWPLRADLAGVTVTVRVDQIQHVRASRIAEVYSEGKCWSLVRVGEIEAAVEQRPISELASRAGKAPAGSNPRAVLQMWDLNALANEMAQKLQRASTTSTITHPGGQNLGDASTKARPWRRISQMPMAFSHTSQQTRLTSGELTQHQKSAPTVV